MGLSIGGAGLHGGLPLSLMEGGTEAGLYGGLLVPALCDRGHKPGISIPGWRGKRWRAPQRLCKLPFWAAASGMDPGLGR